MRKRLAKKDEGTSVDDGVEPKPEPDTNESRLNKKRRLAKKGDDDPSLETLEEEAAKLEED